MDFYVYGGADFLSVFLVYCEWRDFELGNCGGTKRVARIVERHSGIGGTA